jgi:periplasmic divalent cation tolerance protein
VGDIAGVMKATHPYSCPELVTVDVVDGLPDYLRWVSESVADRPPAGAPGPPPS